MTYPDPGGPRKWGRNGVREIRTVSRRVAGTRTETLTLSARGVDPPAQRRRAARPPGPARLRVRVVAVSARGARVRALARPGPRSRSSPAVRRVPHDSTARGTALDGVEVEGVDLRRPHRFPRAHAVAHVEERIRSHRRDSGIREGHAVLPSRQREPQLDRDLLASRHHRRLRVHRSIRADPQRRNGGEALAHFGHEPHCRSSMENRGNHEEIPRGNRVGRP